MKAAILLTAALQQRPQTASPSGFSDQTGFNPLRVARTPLYRYASEKAV